MKRNKRASYLLLVLVLLASLVLAACGGDDDDDDNGDNGDNGGLNLNQTVEGAGLSVSYPEGWVGTFDEDSQQILIANSQSALDKVSSSDPDANPASGEQGLVVQVLPLDAIGMADTPLDEIFEMFTSSLTGEGMETRGDVQDITVGDGIAAKRLDVRDSEGKGEGFLVGFLDDGALVLVIALTADGESAQMEDAAVAIVNTIAYTPVAAEPAE